MNAEARERSLVVGSVAVILLIVVVVLLFVASPLPTAPTCYGRVACGPVFATGNPSSASVCTSINTPTFGCLASNDYFYTLAIEFSSITFGEVLFEVLGPSGAVFAPIPHSSFAILDASGRIVAAFNQTAGGPLAMSEAAGWSYFTSTTGVSSGSPLSSLDSIIIDVGEVDPTNAGYTFVATVTLSPGEANPVALP